MTSTWEIADSHLLDASLGPLRIVFDQLVAHLLNLPLLQFAVQLWHPRIEESEQLIDPGNVDKI